MLLLNSDKIYYVCFNVIIIVIFINIVVFLYRHKKVYMSKMSDRIITVNSSESAYENIKKWF